MSTLRGVMLEDSWVLGWVRSENALIFELEASLWREHINYEKPKPPASSNSSWRICFTDPCGSRRKPSADERARRPGPSKFALGLARRDVMPLHTHLPAPCEYGVGREFRAVVADDHLTCDCR
jgi:hypothetical protein